MKALYLFGLLVFTTTLFAQRPGTVDRSFGRNGRQQDTVKFYTYVTAMAIQPDGKIVIGGSGYSKGSNTFRIDRFTKNGKLDNSFGKRGSVYIFFPDTPYAGTSARWITAVAMLPDGKILAGGYGSYGYTLVRLHNNGNIDSSFGYNGFAIPKGKYYGGYAMAIQKDGKILIGGGLNLAGATEHFFLERVLSNGILDTSFGDKGQVYERVGALNTIAVQADGKIVAAGSSGASNSYNHMLIERYDVNGKLDKSFSDDGVIDTALGNSRFAHVFGLTIQPDGKIIATGDADITEGNVSDFTVLRLNTDGSFDKSFGKEGTVLTVDDSSSSYHGSSIAFVPMLWKDKIIVAGDSYGQKKGHSLKLVSYHSDGTLDTAFGNMGIQKPDTDEDDYLCTAGLQPDGKVILLSQISNYDELYRVRILSRYFGYSTLQPLFASEKSSNGLLSYAPVSSFTISPNPAKDYITIIGLSSDDKSTLVITDALGKTIAVYNSNNASQYRVNVSKFVAGVYYVQIQTNHISETLKFIKE